MLSQTDGRVVLVTGASGFLGSALCLELGRRGYGVRRLVRSSPQASEEFAWSAEGVERSLYGAFAVVHLAGESVVGRWSAAKKRAIRESRVATTSQLAHAIATASAPPQVLISASAIGYYGNQDAAAVDEQAAPGHDFLAQTCVAWEAAADAARAVTRVIHPRLGVVLHPSGGALAQMLPFFRLGLGGPVGGGAQSMSFIGLRDVLGALLWMLEQPALHGPFNLTAPQLVTNAEFTRQLARSVARPAWLPVPAFALRAAYGEFSQELLGSKKVLPRALQAHGYVFAEPTLDDVLRAGLALR